MFSDDSKENHEKQKVTGMVNAPRPTVDQTFIESLGINWVEFQVAFNALCKKWWDASTSVFPDSIGKRLITGALMACPKYPLLVSIVADDLECFRKNYKKSEKDQYIFELCCICGSENILNEFLAQETGNNCLLKSENAIAYALSSEKYDLSLQLAKQALKLGKKDPGQLSLYVASFSAFSFSKNILKIFSNPASVITESTDIDDRKKAVVFTPQHSSGAQKEKDINIGKDKAQKLLAIDEFAEFLRTADLAKIKQFYETIKEDRDEFHKKHRTSHDKP